MNTFSYGPVPTLSKQSTPKNALEGEEASQRFLTPSGHHAQLSRKKENDGPIYTPNGVHALLQRVNGNAPPTITRIRKAPGTNLMFPACDAVRWKTTAQREAERAEALRLQAEEEEKKKKAETEEEAEEEEDVLLHARKKESRCRHNCFLLLWLRREMQIKRTSMLLTMFLTLRSASTFQRTRWKCR